jgi:glutaredoxin-like protein NrdH
MGMIETVEYTIEKGNDIGKDVRIYGLTTCGFCRRAIAYMKDNELAFEYIYIDKIPLEDKKKLKEELKKLHKGPLLFPFLLIDKKDCVSGFVKDKWNDLLNLN